MDFKEIASWKHQDFVDALTEAGEYVINNLEGIQEFVDKHKISPFFSDILDALSRSQLEVETGHTSDYWQRERRIILECFADLFGAAAIVPEEYEILRDWFPELTYIFETMI